MTMTMTLSQPIGHCRWVIAEGYLPPDSDDKSRELVSHEAVCLLNAGAEAAHISLTVYFSDRAPVGPYRAVVAAQRCLHLRFNDLADPAPIPVGVDYSTVIESDVPIVAQHTRLDSRGGHLALMTTLAYAG